MLYFETCEVSLRRTPMFHLYQVPWWLNLSIFDVGLRRLAVGGVASRTERLKLRRESNWCVADARAPRAPPPAFLTWRTKRTPIRTSC